MTTRRRTALPHGGRIRRRLGKLGLPMLQLMSGATTAREYARAVAVVDKLIADRQVAVLRALAAGDVTLAQLIDVDRAGQLAGAGILTTVALRENLWDAAERLFAAADIKPTTRRRYLVAFQALRRKAARWLPADATLGMLGAVDWRAVKAAWGASGDDWMNLRRAISRLLTLALRQKHHPAKVEIMDAIPTAPTAKRNVELTPPMFDAILEHADEDVRASFVALLLTGMRVGEYLACDRTVLRPATLSVLVPGTKTDGSRDSVRVDEAMWPWIEAGIPSRYKYKALRKRWNRACARAGFATYREWLEPVDPAVPDGKQREREEYEGPTLHQLRHCHAQWSVDAGVNLVEVKASMRHATLSMTARYAEQSAKGRVAAALSPHIRRAQ